MNHKDLDLWKRSIDFVKSVYTLTSSFPKTKTYGLTGQIRKAAISISSNLAEGAARTSDKELIHFLYISLGSLAEVETQLIISQELSLIQTIENQLSEIAVLKKLFLGLIKYLKNKKS